MWLSAAGEAEEAVSLQPLRDRHPALEVDRHLLDVVRRCAADPCRIGFAAAIALEARSVVQCCGEESNHRNRLQIHARPTVTSGPAANAPRPTAHSSDQPSASAFSYATASATSSFAGSYGTS